MHIGVPFWICLGKLLNERLCSFRIFSRIFRCVQILIAWTFATKFLVDLSMLVNPAFLEDQSRIDLWWRLFILLICSYVFLLPYVCFATPVSCSFYWHLIIFSTFFFILYICPCIYYIIQQSVHFLWMEKVQTWIKRTKNLCMSYKHPRVLCSFSNHNFKTMTGICIFPSKWN